MGSLSLIRKQESIIDRVEKLLIVNMYSFLAERIMSFNVFGSPHSSVHTHKDTMANKGPNKYKQHSCGIWINASYINHSCINNCHRTFIGDVMIVRATKDLKANTELRFCYQPPTGKGEFGSTRKPSRKPGSSLAHAYYAKALRKHQLQRLQQDGSCSAS